MPISHVTRRAFLGTAAAASVAVPMTKVRARAKYQRCLVTSPAGQKALASYAKGVEAMLKLPADHPQNWFRNAFIHLMDCPHGNWWFYVWHRGYVGYFEQTIRALSGDADFALPYWDWTQLPQIPDGMFDGVLTPTSDRFKPYTETLARFETYFKPSFAAYWNARSPAQKQQLDLRGYKALGDLWNDVTGNGTPADESFAVTPGARYLSAANPKLDQDTMAAVSATTVRAGLQAASFNDPVGALSFTSSKTASHNEAPSQATVFSVLEGQPHNLVHNCIGGVGAIDPGPYGNMTNFLSPVDPIFFLHHANMDRLWDVWTRKQKSLRRPYLPDGKDLKTFSEEPFLFFVDGKGHYVRHGRAADYISTDRFNYEYDHNGFGEDLIGTAAEQLVAQAASPAARARVSGNAASIALPKALLSRRPPASETARPVVAQITIARPENSSTRQFRVFIGAPADATDLGPDSPYYAGTVGFFGAPMAGMKMSHEAKFSLPLPSRLPALAAALAATEAHGNLAVRIVPIGGKKEAPPVLKGFAIEAL